MTTEQKTFIENIAAAARKHAANYGIAVISQSLRRRLTKAGGESQHLQQSTIIISV